MTSPYKTFNEEDLEPMCPMYTVFSRLRFCCSAVSLESLLAVHFSTLSVKTFPLSKTWTKTWTKTRTTNTIEKDKSLDVDSSNGFRLPESRQRSWSSARYAAEEPKRSRSAVRKRAGSRQRARGSGEHTLGRETRERIVQKRSIWKHLEEHLEEHSEKQRTGSTRLLVNNLVNVRPINRNGCLYHLKIIKIRPTLKVAKSALCVRQMISREYHSQSRHIAARLRVTVSSFRTERTVERRAHSSSYPFGLVRLRRTTFDFDQLGTTSNTTTRLAQLLLVDLR